MHALRVTSWSKLSRLVPHLQVLFSLVRLRPLGGSSLYPLPAHHNCLGVLRHSPILVHSHAYVREGISDIVHRPFARSNHYRHPSTRSTRQLKLSFPCGRTRTLSYYL
ncbi:hypothetical protein EDB89DRAFT_1960966 [Lactarius sanguifluus]|nr:hypothetical protein EDB89DRAFT_1960966 [Lactarius sanguifluus]